MSEKELKKIEAECATPAGIDLRKFYQKVKEYANQQTAKDFRVEELRELLNKVVKMQRSTFGDATSLHLKLAVLVKEIEQTLKQD